MTGQEYLDAMAAQQHWEVVESTRVSVYKRGSDMVVLEFGEDGEFTGGEHVRVIPADGKLWKGHIGNILRHRSRGVVHE